MTVLTRRSLLGGIGALLAAPAIVRVASLMPVRAWDDDPLGLSRFETIGGIDRTVVNWWKPITLNGVPIYPDANWPDGQLYMLSLKQKMVEILLQQEADKILIGSPGLVDLLRRV